MADRHEGFRGAGYSNEELLVNFQRWMLVISQSGEISDRAIGRALGLNHRTVGAAREAKTWRDGNSARRVCYALGDLIWTLSVEDLLAWSDVGAAGERQSALEMTETLEFAAAGIAPDGAGADSADSTDAGDGAFGDASDGMNADAAPDAASVGADSAIYGAGAPVADRADFTAGVADAASAADPAADAADSDSAGGADSNAADADAVADAPVGDDAAGEIAAGGSGAADSAMADAGVDASAVDDPAASAAPVDDSGVAASGVDAGGADSAVIAGAGADSVDVPDGAGVDADSGGEPVFAVGEVLVGDAPAGDVAISEPGEDDGTDAAGGAAPAADAEDSGDVGGSGAVVGAGGAAGGADATEGGDAAGGASDFAAPNGYDDVVGDFSSADGRDDVVIADAADGEDSSVSDVSASVRDSVRAAGSPPPEGAVGARVIGRKRKRGCSVNGALLAA